MSPISSTFGKIGFCTKHKPLKVMVLGQAGVGKTALVVRFITKRFIGEYDPTLEKIYTCHTLVENEMVNFEILDTAGQTNEMGWLTLETNIRWAEVFILVYSITDKCSFDECNRLKFLINYNKRRKRLGSSNSKDLSLSDVLVALVGNKIDQCGDRMVTPEEGQKKSQEIGCVRFYEISVRESIEQVCTIFHDLWHHWKLHLKFPKLRRSCSEMHSPVSSPVYSSGQNMLNRKSIASIMLGRRWTEVDSEEDDNKRNNGQLEHRDSEGSLIPFRNRASTDSQVSQQSKQTSDSCWHVSPATSPTTKLADRRMSISMRGNNLI